MSFLPRRQLGFASLLGFLVFLALAAFFCTVNARGADTGPYARSPMTPIFAGSTGSMEPTIHAGQRLLVDYPPFSELKVGDIILRWVNWSPTPHTPILHRIVRVTLHHRFITRGDHNDRDDPDVMYPQDFAGRVTKIFP